MKKAEYNEKNLIVDILTKSFESNQSVNYIVKQDEKKLKRIEALMNYSFEVCYLFGDVFLSDDNKACALVLYPDKKKTTIKSIMLDVNLILSCVGIENIKKTLDREAIIKKIQPKVPMYYLWFIGVDPDFQNTGIGSVFLDELIEDSRVKGRPIYLETSTLKNLPWYQKFGFNIYHEADLSYKLFFLRRELAKP
ncbi:MAG: GNAT family N-acetyltransferase [Sphingobacteriia bacterium 24-36-13]|jgi:ribosomal protein S18 acetylase RimI-like enzyme|uniref:GNAT family N-acetyltransferase n=1 Tax=Sediminibacterium sp. TaxID=1917865 RepID=UPI000BCCBE75|nr:GNAT family N-acetyltransferase [Sediminibacterium sp.]OYZ55314.1 MAG: GNAT family N-acetyltransferase [Sphingobacteriia bacterium 24-36-13]OZA66274.1 MAG: GNAT family N-acetyltransferase [Sphingobacteriia bacterium 39-36-14]HQS22851.1 GNAT family N-acetyltransferase [Sediminibacterium sp.]HQS33972.1 GNAT family N-acetyltransferase [Sediminibacterium sp.]